MFRPNLRKCHLLIFKASIALDTKSLKILYFHYFIHIFILLVKYREILTTTSIHCIFMLRELVLRTITNSEYTNSLFSRLNILELNKEIIGYKSYLLAFKAFNTILPNTMNSFVNVKQRSTNKFSEDFCKSMSFSIISVALNIKTVGYTLHSN